MMIIMMMTFIVIIQRLAEHRPFFPPVLPAVVTIKYV